MIIDLTYPLPKEKLEQLLELATTAKYSEKFGHFGTHFDCMGHEFSIDNCKRNGKIFDISSIREREVNLEDIDISKIEENDFIIFYTGIMEKNEYATPEYMKNNPELSNTLIRYLIDKKVSLIGFDMGGIRKSSEHAIVDQYCADNGVFIIENLTNLNKLIEFKDKQFIVYTYPILIVGSTGLPTRVITEIFQ
ncbi:cyclase family protein [Desulfosporosinus shakirovi]|uniref:cyclase family protein n=1 Tax=Desulfosporosinus shakirovi TaxID=2885154 RepID=UPI001E2B210D|nr:cyclase family protein [Desulfosporosinus sp. SRJS8]MCB8815313.1 cyclase family protein [Desulfosporosinus sp. SRJS8]